MKWEEYLAKGAFAVVNDTTTLYHMCEVSRWEAVGNKVYYPPTYEQDGFIHATADPSMLLTVANHFYKDSTDSWICMELNPSWLGARVVYEPAAPVGKKDTMHRTEGESVPLFPHIYGGIPKLAVTKIFKINRSATGDFLSIENLC